MSEENEMLARTMEAMVMEIQEPHKRAKWLIVYLVKM